MSENRFIDDGALDTPVAPVVPEVEAPVVEVIEPSVEVAPEEVK
jgi:hypothetical protein